MGFFWKLLDGIEYCAMFVLVLFIIVVTFGYAIVPDNKKKTRVTK